MNKKLLVSTLLLAISSAQVFAYDFHEKTKAKIDYGYMSLSKTGGATNITVLESSDNGYPKGTVFTGTFFGHKDPRRLSRGEVVKVEISSAKLPNGNTENLKKVFKIVPRTQHRNLRWAGNTAFLASGIALGLTVDFFALGLPVGRGGLGAWNAVMDAHEAESSKLKAGLKGFVKGALMPLPWLILKGPELNLDEGSELEIQEGDEDDEQITAYRYIGN